MNHLEVAAGFALAAALVSAPAHAKPCDSLQLSDEAEDVVLGEIGFEVCKGESCYFEPYNRPTLGACWRGPDGVWHIELLSCDSETPAGDYLSVYAEGGDDRVAVLRAAHTLGDPSLVPYGKLGAMRCGGEWNSAIAPWHRDFDFGIDAVLGAGSDIFHGSDAADSAWTNEPVYVWGTGWTSLADGSRPDLACTYGGDDYIAGDRDDDFKAGTEDWMDGGDGSDSCIGDYGWAGSDYSDLYRSCESHYGAYPDLPYVDLIHCQDSDDPLHDW